MYRATPISVQSEKTPQIANKTMSVQENIEMNIVWVQQYFSHCSDLLVRRFLIGISNPCEAALLYLDGMTDSSVIHDDILRPLMRLKNIAVADCFSFTVSQLLPVGEVTFADSLTDGVLAMMNGDAFLLLSGSSTGLIIDSKGFPHRTIGEPRNEKVLRGPQESFVEAMRVNTALIRRRLHTNQLKLEQLTLGEKTQTQVTIAYLDQIADRTIIDEVHHRLNQIQHVEGILNSSFIEQYIEDTPFSIFPQIQYTERPDKVASALLEGRVALIVDGSPDVILLPVFFAQLLQSPEDSYTRIIPGTFIRWIRYMGLLVATTLPSLYVAVTSFHPELLPLPLLLSITTAREGVPFPAFLEALMMELAFELLREASIRMPGAIGNTIGIVGALVIGDAAVSARLVAPQMVIVVAITAIGSFAIPSVEASDSVRLIRFPLMLLAAAFGLYGVVFGWIIIVLHLVQLRSFGVPYMQPFAPYKKSEIIAFLVRLPLWKMKFTLIKPEGEESCGTPKTDF